MGFNNYDIMLSRVLAAYRMTKKDDQYPGGTIALPGDLMRLPYLDYWCAYDKDDKRLDQALLEIRRGVRTYNRYSSAYNRTQRAFNSVIEAVADIPFRTLSPAQEVETSDVEVRLVTVDSLHKKEMELRPALPPRRHRRDINVFNTTTDPDTTGVLDSLEVALVEAVAQRGRIKPGLLHNMSLQPTYSPPPASPVPSRQPGRFAPNPSIPSTLPARGINLPEHPKKTFTLRKGRKKAPDFRFI